MQIPKQFYKMFYHRKYNFLLGNGFYGGRIIDCKIRHWRMEDAESLATALNNKKIHDNLRDGLPLPYTVKDAEIYITAMLEADKNTTYAFAVTAHDKAIGSIGVFRKDNIHFQTAEMGYYIAEPYWGQEFGTSAVRQVCQYIFDNTDIIRIFAEPFAYNHASCRIVIPKNRSGKEDVFVKGMNKYCESLSVEQNFPNILYQRQKLFYLFLMNTIRVYCQIQN